MISGKTKPKYNTKKQKKYKQFSPNVLTKTGIFFSFFLSFILSFLNRCPRIQSPGASGLKRFCKAKNKNKSGGSILRFFRRLALKQLLTNKHNSSTKALHMAQSTNIIQDFKNNTSHPRKNKKENKRRQKKKKKKNTSYVISKFSTTSSSSSLCVLLPAVDSEQVCSSNQLFFSLLFSDASLSSSSSCCCYDRCDVPLPYFKK